MSDIGAWLGGGLIATIVLGTLWAMFNDGPPPGGLSSGGGSSGDDGGWLSGTGSSHDGHHGSDGDGHH
jgi:hypothetical protein